MEEVKEPSSMMYDIRTEKEKHNDAYNIHTNTIKQEMELYSDKPELIGHQPTKDLYWFTSVHQLRGQNALLHICGNSDSDEKVDFKIYNAKYPYKIQQTITVDM